MQICTFHLIPRKRIFTFTPTCILHPRGGNYMDDLLCRCGRFMHFKAESCMRGRANLPDGNWVAKPESFLVPDIKCNFQQKMCKLGPSITYWREKTSVIAWRVSFIQTMERKQGLCLGNYFCYKISIKILTKNYQYQMQVLFYYNKILENSLNFLDIFAKLPP